MSAKDVRRRNEDPREGIGRPACRPRPFRPRPLPALPPQGSPPPAPPRLVTVAPGQHASSKFHWTVVPAASETSNPCEPVPSVLVVTPPDETATLRTPWPGGSVCQLGRIDVTPFKPGTGS